MTSPTRIVIADDHPMFREGLLRTIDGKPEFTVVGKAADGIEALRLIRDLRPDVAVLDVTMPGKNGLEVTRAAHEEALPTEIVILTMHADLSYFNTALDLGVRGYILKDGALGEFLSCLTSVRDGQYYISPVMSHMLVEREQRLQALARDIPALQRLTPAERSILGLVARNLTSREIADKLFVSIRTVECHRMHISQKLGINGPHKLLEFALEHKEDL